MKRRIGTAVVVGAGIAGIRAALDLAEYGYGVTLVERAPHLGGILSQLDYQFPTDHCGMCRMLPLVQRDAATQHCLRRGLFHENISILLGTEITHIAGAPGKLRLTFKQQTPWVDPERCVGCGRCTPVCPVEVPDEFNAGLTRRKAVYLPVPHNLPNAYVLDAAACTRCGACVPACPTGAIRLPETERGKFRILVVDDELVVRDSLKEWLEAGKIRPVIEAGINLRVLNTFNPTNPGTLILADPNVPENRPNGKIKAVTVIRSQRLVTVEGRGMLGVPGVAARTFSAVAATGTSVPLITQASSEQSICFAVPSNAIQRVLSELDASFEVELARRDIDRIWSTEEVVIITIVGAGMRSTPGIAGRIFTALGQQEVNVIAIAQGSSEVSISVVVDALDTQIAMNAIHSLIH